MGYSLASFSVGFCEHNGDVEAFKVVRIQVYGKQNLERNVVTGQQIHRFVSGVEIVDDNCDISGGFQLLLDGVGVKTRVRPHLVPETPGPLIMFTESFLHTVIKLEDQISMEGGCLSECQREILRCKRWWLMAGVRRLSPRKGVQGSLLRMRPLFYLDESEVRVNPRLGGRTRNSKHRAPLNHQIASHLRQLTIRVEHKEPELGVSQAQFWKILR